MNNEHSTETETGEKARGDPQLVYRSGPAFSGPTTAMSATQARDYVLANAGGQRTAWEQRIVDDVVAGTSAWFNGEGHPAPNPYWP